MPVSRFHLGVGAEVGLRKLQDTVYQDWAQSNAWAIWGPAQCCVSSIGTQIKYSNCEVCVDSVYKWWRWCTTSQKHLKMNVRCATLRTCLPPPKACPRCLGAACDSIAKHGIRMLDRFMGILNSNKFEWSCFCLHQYSCVRTSYLHSRL